MIERRSLTGELSVNCARTTAADECRYGLQQSGSVGLRWDSSVFVVERFQTGSFAVCRELGRLDLTMRSIQRSDAVLTIDLISRV